MSPRARVVALTAAAAVGVAAVVVGVVSLHADPVGEAAPRPQPQRGVPPLTLELDVRGDREAVALRRAARQYADSQARTCAALSIDYKLHTFPPTATFDDIAGRILLLNTQPEAAAIMVHLPLPKGGGPFEQLTVALYRALGIF